MIFEKFIEDIRQWGEINDAVESIIIVGSYARGTSKTTSDIDLCIISSNKNEMINNHSFTGLFGDIKEEQLEYYGACTSIRTWYKDGKEVEFGIVSPSWIEQPLDRGTFQVLNDGYKILVDKKQYFTDIDIK